MKRFLLALFISVLACGGYYAYAKFAPGERDFKSELVSFRLVTVAYGLHHPWSVAFLPDGSYLVTERRGRLLHVSQDGETKTEIKGVPQVKAEGQGGLLDVYVPSDFKDGDQIYISYSGIDANNEELSGTEVIRAKLSVRQSRLIDAEVIFSQTPKLDSRHHYGSRIVEARDGTLFISTGDRGDKDRAQDPQNHQGVIVRINKDGSIPEDNPFVGNDKGLPEIYSYGHRNPQGMAMHPETGRLWIHEHGPQGGDEINLPVSGGNFGWPAATYGRNYVIGTKISEHTSLPGMVDPIWQWTPSIAPSGMAFYTGDKIPEWTGHLFVGALAHRKMERMVIDGETIAHREILIEEFKKRIRDVANGPDGYLYILTDETNGELIRIVPR